MLYLKLPLAVGKKDQNTNSIESCAHSPRNRKPKSSPRRATLEVFNEITSPRRATLEVFNEITSPRRATLEVFNEITSPRRATLDVFNEITSPRRATLEVFNEITSEARNKGKETKRNLTQHVGESRIHANCRKLGTKEGLESNVWIEERWKIDNVRNQDVI